ncbi:alpha/beta hydrolase [Nocardia sp. NPDC051030]|uniref:alpha/beta fold hydrolase n=1 Tax=Nocardia sp. NPDC051030 TaxID=3155162 RepID=UPI00342CF419
MRTGWKERGAEDLMLNVERSTRLADLSGGPVEYRLEQHGPQTVMMLHGGHMRASLPFGEGVFTDAGFSVLAPSRPGYGRTPLGAGPSPEAYADSLAELCHHLGIERLAAVVGQSASGPTAVTFAAAHPDLVARLVLESAVGFQPWPEKPSLRIGGPLMFHARTQRATWGLVHALARHAPNIALRLLLRDLSIHGVDELLATFSGDDRESLLAYFTRMNSGAGFAADLHALRHPAAMPKVTQPTLVIASPDDAAVPFAQARSLAEDIPAARLITSRAPSHYIWFGADYPVIADAIIDFVGSTAP